MTGLVGGGLMVAVVDVFGVAGAGPTPTVFALVGAAVGASDARLAGLVAHAFVSMLLGVLHASCLGDGPVKGVVGVGLFYGAVVWVVGGFVAGWILGEELRSMTRTLPWFCGHLAYVAPMTCAALFAHGRRAGRVEVAPLH